MKKASGSNSEVQKTKKNRKGKGAGSGSGTSKGLEAATLLAVGLGVGGEAIAAIRSESSSSDNSALSAAAASELLTSELAQLQAAEGELPLAAEGEEDKVAAEGEESEVAAEDAEASGAPIELADASEALGIVSERPIELGEPMKLAQAQTAPAGAGATGAKPADAGATGSEAAGGAEAGAEAAAINPLIIFGVVALGAAAAGGGGGGGGALAPVPAPGVAGFAAKGPLSGATVFYDMDGDGLLSAGDIQTTTAADGTFSFSAADVAAGAGKNLIAQGGTLNGVAFTGKMMAAPGTTEITPFSTLKAAGVPESLLTEMLGEDPDDLDLADFAAGTGSAEAEALALFELINKYTGENDDADKIELMAKAIGDALANAKAAGANLADPDVMANLNVLLDGIVAAIDQQFDADPTVDLSDPLIAAMIDSADATIVAEGANLNGVGTVDPYQAYAASIGATWNGSQYVLTETVAEALLAAGGFSNLGTTAGSAASIVLVAEGTLLGDAGNALTGDELATLGVDFVHADAAEPYLHLLAGNLAAGGGLGGTVIGVGAGVVAVGTDFSVGDQAALSGLGVDVSLLGDDPMFGTGSNSGD